MTAPLPIRRVILHLGGDPARIATTIAHAIAYPSAPIIISSESEPAQLLAALEAAAIPRRRVTFDFRAWDTVTNYVATLDLVRRHLALGRVAVIPVSGRSHLVPRGDRLARMIYEPLGIRVVLAPHDDRATPSREPWHGLWWDVARTWLWRRTGVLLYNPFIRWRRMKRVIRPAEAQLRALEGPRPRDGRDGRPYMRGGPRADD